MSTITDTTTRRAVLDALKRDGRNILRRRRGI
jgi:hypothetical protein